MKSLIQKLVETPGPPGYEEKIRSVVRTEVEPLVEQVQVDSLGNLIARKGQKGGDGLRIMLAAHIDEIGVIATHIDEHGYVRFTPLGGVNPRSCPGGRVSFLNGAMGVIGVERSDRGGNAPDFEQMFIDVGASTRADCPVRVGDVAVFERPMLDMGKRLISKALDDRVGVAVLVETLRRIDAEAINSPHQLFFVFSVQEEVGLRGAKTAAFGIDPDLGLAVDITGSGDTPKGLRMDIGLGKGPAIKVRDAGMLSDPRVVRWMVERAEGAGLPYQLEVLERGTTDARAIQITRAGVPSGCLSVPCRYIHAPSEMVDIDDVENTVRLMIELLKEPIHLA